MELTLFYKQTCPFCKKVIQFMDRNEIKVPMKNISGTPSYQNDLISIGGKKQVPCLVIDGSALYESDDIIDWMKKHLID